MVDELNLTSFREYFGRLLKEAKFDVRVLPIREDLDPVVFAENPYYVIAFQAFDSWEKLYNNYENIETALSQLIEKHPQTPKVWDSYLVLVCRGELYNQGEFDEYSDLIYNTRYTRKIVRAGVNDLTTIDEVVKPFIQLKKARSRARERDPLTILMEKMIKDGIDENVVKRLITLYKEGGDLSIV